jgi:hypothetical protein
MPYGTISDELYLLIKGKGIEMYMGEELPNIRIDIVYEGALDESFHVTRESDHVAIVDAIFEHITTRSYFEPGQHLVVDAYFVPGDGDSAVYKRETEED